MGSANIKTPSLQDRRWGFFVLEGKDLTRPHSSRLPPPCDVPERGKSVIESWSRRIKDEKTVELRTDAAIAFRGTVI